MIPKNGDSQATWAFLQAMTGLNPSPADPDSTIRLAILPDNVAATDEGVAGGTYPQTDAHPRQDLSLDEARALEEMEQYLELSPQPLAGPIDSTPGFPAVDSGASERAEDYSGQAWRMVEQVRGDRPPASPDEHDAPIHAGSLVLPADEGVAGGTYPQTDAHPRQDLSLDEARALEEMERFLELSPQPLAGPIDSTPGFPAVDGGASERAEDYEQALGILRKHLPKTMWGMAESWLAEGEEDYSGQAWRMVEQVRGDPFPASLDEHDALTQADRPQISASAALEADLTVSGLAHEQPAILNETMGPRDRAGAKRGRPATEHEEDGRAAKLRQLKVPQPVAGATDWLGDEHIKTDYDCLAKELRQTYPRLAAQTRFVSPAVVAALRSLEGEPLQTELGGLNLNDAGQVARFLFLPVSNANGVSAGTHWSLLFVDRRHPQGPRAYHYDSKKSSAQLENAHRLARKFGATAREGEMAQQSNGYDCGVFVLEATHELVTRLANSQPPEGASLDHRSVVADRTALLARHGARPAIAFPSDEKMDDGPDLDAIAAATPRQPGQSKGAWADALKAAHPDLSAADAAIIVRATKSDIARRAAFQTVSAQDQARLAAIAAATPRQPGQSNGAWADALKAAHPDLSAADAAIIVGATKREIVRRAAFKAVSAQDQARLYAIAAATPRQPGQSNAAWADALKAAHPDLSAADAAIIVGGTKDEIVRRAAFKAVSAQDEVGLAAIAAATPRQPGQSNGAWADALKAAHPDLSAADAAIIVGATKGNIARRAAFKAVSAQDQARLNAIAAATPRSPRQKKGAWADALKAAHPELSAADAAKIVGATKDEIASRGAFKAVSAQDQARLNAIAAATPRSPRQKKGPWADALKAAHPDLSAADAAIIVRATKSEIAKRAAFKAVSAQLRMINTTLR
ncbi:hypothetical protein BPNPMPFG_006744 (plasmid) [Mesorhizobium sp. AR07]|uniref:Ulp1 family isopeptidase n=1 Tax=Mesorhizobium sp. AR07 TaxID=2865838 RepID=UPI00215E7363|nr:Ulp1 family isopeptidase [Mesorhizobium sp. AR07]UVK49061.1 hypothetical protein BPNPMPFG_006744 [Mesorhizobium sp. AR07]